MKMVNFYIYLLKKTQFVWGRRDGEHNLLCEGKILILRDKLFFTKKY